jgi:hypothetical protein
MHLHIYRSLEFLVLWFCCWLELVVFYCRVGIVFCGRQAPGGHNVVWGLYEALKVHNAKNTLLGFLGKSLFFIC